MLGVRKRRALSAANVISEVQLFVPNQELRLRRTRMFATVVAPHFPPRAVLMPRPSSAAAICRSDFAPAAWASRMAGATFAANAYASVLTARASASLGLPNTVPLISSAFRTTSKGRQWLLCQCQQSHAVTRRTADRRGDAVECASNVDGVVDCAEVSQQAIDIAT